MQSERPSIKNIEKSMLYQPSGVTSVKYLMKWSEGKNSIIVYVWYRGNLLLAPRTRHNIVPIADFRFMFLFPTYFKSITLNKNCIQRFETER